MLFDLEPHHLPRRRRGGADVHLWRCARRRLVARGGHLFAAGLASVGFGLGLAWVGQSAGYLFCFALLCFDLYFYIFFLFSFPVPFGWRDRVEYIYIYIYGLSTLALCSCSCSCSCSPSRSAVMWRNNIESLVEQRCDSG